MKRRKKSPLKKLKEKLWQLCREIIIKRYGNICYTCRATPLIGANLQIGHFIPSSVSSTSMRYDCENLRPQCFRCNIHLSGNWPAYENHLKMDGIDVEALKRRNEETKGLMYRDSWYEAKILEYEEIKRLSEESLLS